MFGNQFSIVFLLNKLFYIRLTDFGHGQMENGHIWPYYKNILPTSFCYFHLYCKKTFLQKYTQQSTSTYYQKMLGLVSTGDLSHTRD